MTKFRSGKLVAVVLALLWPNVAQAQDATILAGSVLDVATGELMPASVIRVVDGLIAGIEPASPGGIPGVAIDLSDFTVLPGLIDVHTHLCDASYEGDSWQPWEMAAPAFGVRCVVGAREMIEAGFTTVRNVAEPFYAGVAIRDAIAQGLVPGPRVFASGPMISMTGGHGDWGNWMGPQHGDATPAEAVADGEDAVRGAVREQLKRRVDWIKLAATGGFASSGTVPGAAAYTVAEMRVAVEEAGKRGLYVAAHAHGAVGLRNALEAGVRSIEHGTFLDAESLELLARHEAFLVPDLFAAYFHWVELTDASGDTQAAEDRAQYDAFAARVGRAAAAGVHIAFGTDAGAAPHGRGAEQFALMVDAGMEPMEAIRSATVVASQLLGVEKLAGSVEVGKWADLIAVRGNPVVDVTTLEQVQFVMKSGRVYRRAQATTR